MPKRIDIQEGECIEIGGLSVGLVQARDKRAVVLIGVFDGDNLLEGPEEVRAAVKRYRDSIDKAKRGRNTSG